MVLAIAISAGGLALMLAEPRGGGVTTRVLADLSPVQSDSAVQEGALFVQARCVICHSVDLVTQQRLNRAQWNATVSKMVHWGAPLTASEQKVLVGYLALRYHPDASEVKTERE